MPVNFFLNSGSCVATPTEHVLRWHFLSIMQPIEINAPVAIPHSSAPNNAPIRTSFEVFICPSVCTTILSLSPLATNTCLFSAKPRSHGTPAWRIELNGEAPVPPESPEMRTTSPLPFATPAAITPTPATDTSLTCTLDSGLTFLRSCINWAKSSIE